MKQYVAKQAVLQSTQQALPMEWERIILFIYLFYQESSIALFWIFLEFP